MEITIQSNTNNPMIDAQYSLITEEIIFGAGEYTELKEVRGRGKDFLKGIFGYDEYRIKVPNEGEIIYKNWNTLQGYLGIVKLKGFDDKSEKFKKLKNTLESIVNTKDIIQLEYDLFPEKFKETSVEEVKKKMGLTHYLPQK